MGEMWVVTVRWWGVYT